MFMFQRTIALITQSLLETHGDVDPSSAEYAELFKTTVLPLLLSVSDIPDREFATKIR
jgi:hypothetical protein